METREREAVTSTLLDLAGNFDGDELTDQLDKFGWQDLYRSEPVEAVAALFGAQGRAGAWSSSLHDVLAIASHLGVHDLRSSTVLIPRPHREVSIELQGGTGVIEGLTVGARSDNDSLVAVAGAGPRTMVLQIPRQAVTFSQITGLDDRLTMHRVSGLIGDWELLGEGDEALRWWATAVAEARRAIALTMCGAMESMLALAVSHANGRQQFGRPVGTFQAVRHRLAACRIAISGAAAAASASFSSTEPEFAALVAKIVAGRAQSSVGTHCQQVLAGIGFTAEHPFHTFAARTLTLDRLFGSAVELAPVTGRTLIRRGEAARLVEL
jgi:hypothetical protein